MNQRSIISAQLRDLTLYSPSGLTCPVEMTVDLTETVTETGERGGPSADGRDDNVPHTAGQKDELGLRCTDRGDGCGWCSRCGWAAQPVWPSRQTGQSWHRRAQQG